MKGEMSTAYRKNATLSFRNNINFIRRTHIMTCRKFFCSVIIVMFLMFSV